MPRKFLLIHAKINTNVWDFACDTYYFFINFLILALLLAGELSTLTLSFNSPTIIPITLFTLFRSNSGFSLMVDFVRLIWYLYSKYHLECTVTPRLYPLFFEI